MDVLNEFLMQWGYWGMLISAFIAGSILPFSSEAVMVGLQAAGLEALPLVIYASIGNVLGAMVNYAIGMLGRMEWIHKYLHVSSEQIEKTQKLMAGKGACVGFLAFLPVIGDCITIVLGLTRANIPISIISIAIGKVLRYATIAYGFTFVF